MSTGNQIESVSTENFFQSVNLEFKVTIDQIKSWPNEKAFYQDLFAKYPFPCLARIFFEGIGLPMFLRNSNQKPLLLVVSKDVCQTMVWSVAKRTNFCFPNKSRLFSKWMVAHFTIVLSFEFWCLLPRFSKLSLFSIFHYLYTIARLIERTALQGAVSNFAILLMLVGFGKICQ